MARPMRVLSVDGGGIRGVIPASVLTEIERIVQDREGPDARLVDYVDLVAGTSTGAIIVGLLVLPVGDGPDGRDRFSIRSAQDILDFYLNQGPVLFRRTLGDRIRRAGALFDERYGSAGFLRVLDETVGPTRDVMLSELARPTVITTYNATTGQPYFFKQHRALEPEGRDFTLHDVARATAAAPTYFETVDVRADGEALGACVDGGVFANNPTMCAYAEARGYFGYGVADMAILSLGTGSSLKSYTYEQMRNWGVTRWMKPVLDMMMAGSERATDYQIRQIFETVSPDAPETQYLRLQANLGDEPDSVAEMDNVTPANLDRLVAIGREVVDQNREAIERFVDTQLLGPSEPATTTGASSRTEGP